MFWHSYAQARLRCSCSVDCQAKTHSSLQGSLPRFLLSLSMLTIASMLTFLFTTNYTLRIYLQSHPEFKEFKEQ